jgi:MOSC domain-containing protein YiiM
MGADSPRARPRMSSSPEGASSEAVAPARRGVIVGIHIKPETIGERGLPKRAVPEVHLSSAGLDGDFNIYRHEEKHDDPKVAVLLYPREMIEQLNREGWPVRMGDIGENFATEGIPYDGFEIGHRFRLGAAEIEITKPCDPCDNLGVLPYVGTERVGEFMRTMLHRRGWYARVIREGTVRRGDPIREIV